MWTCLFGEPSLWVGWWRKWLFLVTSCDTWCLTSEELWLYTLIWTGEDNVLQSVVPSRYGCAKCFTLYCLAHLINRSISSLGSLQPCCKLMHGFTTNTLPNTQVRHINQNMLLFARNQRNLFIRDSYYNFVSPILFHSMKSWKNISNTSRNGYADLVSRLMNNNSHHFNCLIKNVSVLYQTLV